MSSDSEKPPGKLTSPPAYNQRDVLGLKPISQWGALETEVHIKHNRIMQPGFMHRDASNVLEDAKLTGEEWLTDVCCPTVKSELFLHLSKDMVVRYKVHEEELSENANKALEYLLHNNRALLDEIQSNVQTKLNDISNENIRELALERLVKNKIIEPSGEQIEAAQRIILDIERRKITSALVSEFLQSHYPELENRLGLSVKHQYNQGENKDFVFLGAAGSGKSTISRQCIEDTDKTEYAIIATDNYRIFSQDGLHSPKDTKDKFAETQDMAYLVKVLVVNDIKSQQARPNIIFDAITLDSSIQQILTQGNNVKSFVAGYPKAEGVADRTHARAQDPASAAADKGRYVNTTDLLEGHANASARFLTSIPPHVVTEIYNTNIEIGEKPQVMALIDPVAHEVRIDDLRVMSEFLNKQNINIEAGNTIGLLVKDGARAFSTHPENKARSILGLIQETEYKRAYSVKLIDKDSGKEYAQLFQGKDRKVIELNIIDDDIFKAKALADSPEAQVLRSVTRQVVYGVEGSKGQYREVHQRLLDEAKDVSDVHHLRGEADKQSFHRALVLLEAQRIGKDIGISRISVSSEGFNGTVGKKGGMSLL